MIQNKHSTIVKMLWWLLALILAPVSIFVGALVLRMVRSWINLQYYKRQGIPVFFEPTGGVYSLFSKKYKENHSRSSMEYLKKIVNQPDSKGVFAVNNLTNHRSLVMIYKPEYVREFIPKEDYFYKVPAFGSKEIVRAGMFFETGEKLMQSKAVFSRIFAYEGMEQFVPPICQMIHSEFIKFNETYGVNTNSFTKVNIDNLFGPIINKVADILIFGRTGFGPEDDETKLAQLHKEAFDNIFHLRSNLLFILFPEFTEKFKLSSLLGQNKGIFQRMGECMARIVNRREENPIDGKCIADRMAAFNKECRESGNLKDVISDEDLAGNYNLFFVAGTDTSQNTSKMALCHMADKPDCQKIIQSVLADIYDEQGITQKDKLDQNQLLDLWIKEALRLHNPVSRLNARMATRDVKLGDITVRKGDRISILMTGLNFDGSVYGDIEKFKIEQFDKGYEKNMARYQYIPFSVGKRVCLGRNLGEMMVKLFVTQFVRAYEFNKPKDFEYYESNFFQNALVESLLEVKLKSDISLMN